MNRIVFDPDARREFLAAVAYYESCQPGLGERFSEVVEAAARRIGEMPLKYRVIRHPFRRCIVPHFPYGILYTIRPEHILIVAIAHAKRKPGYWLKRTKLH